MGADSPRLRKFLQAALGEEALTALEQGLAAEPKLAKAMPQRAVLSWALKACQYNYDGPVPGQDDLWLSLSKSGATLVCDQERVELGSDLYKIAAALALTLELEPEPQQLATKAAQRLGKSLDQLVGTRMVRVEMETVQVLQKAISQIAPGKPSGPNTHDYSHVLSPEHRAQGYEVHVEHRPETGGLHSRILHRGQKVGEAQAHLAGDQIEVQHVDLDPQHRGKGLGTAMHEAAWAHGFHQGAKKDLTGVHSTSESRVLQALARKHGTGYAPVPTPFPHLAFPEGDFDNRYGPAESMLKAWPKDEHENQANAATHQVLEDQMLEQGAEKKVDPGTTIQGETYPTTPIALPKNLNQKASQKRTWTAAAANRKNGGPGGPHSGNYNIPGPNEIGPPGGLPDNTADMGGWNVGGPGLDAHGQWKREQTQANDRTFWRRLDLVSHQDAHPIPELTRGKSTFRFQHGYDTSTSTGGVPDEPRRQVMVTMRDAFHEGGENAPHSTVGMWNPHTGAWSHAPHPDYADLHAELTPHLQSWFQANPMAKAELEKKTAPTFPKLGFADDRRETVIADTPRQKQMASRVQAQSVKNLAKDPQQAQHLGVDLRGVDSQEIDQHFRERGFTGKGALGSVAVGPNPGPHAIGPNMRRATYQSLNPGLQDENESLNDPDSVRPVQLHENLHGLFNRVANKHGGDARNALTQNLWGWVSYRAPKAAHAVQEALKRFYNFDGQSGKPPFEEFLATTLNLANSKSDRADLNFRLGLDEKQGRQLHQAFNTVHRHMGEGGKLADDRWLSPHGFKQFLMSHARTAAPEQQSRPDQQDPLDFMVGMSPRERAQTVQAMQPPKKHFLDDMPMRKAEGWSAAFRHKKTGQVVVTAGGAHHNVGELPGVDIGTEDDDPIFNDWVAGFTNPKGVFHTRAQASKAAGIRWHTDLEKAELRKGWPRSEAENEANRQGFVRESPPTEDAIMEGGLDTKQVHGVSPGHNPVHDVTNLSNLKDIDRRHAKQRELQQLGTMSWDESHRQAFGDRQGSGVGIWEPNRDRNMRQARQEHPELDTYDRNPNHGSEFSIDRGADRAEDREIETERQRMRRGSMDPQSYFQQKEDSFWRLLGTAADFHAKKPTSYVANSRARIQVQKLPDELFSRMHASTIKKGWPRSEKQNQENAAGFIRESPPTEDRLMEQGLSTKTQHGVRIASNGEARFPSGKPAAFVADGLAPQFGEPAPMFDFSGARDINEVGAYQRRSRNTFAVRDVNRAADNREYNRDVRAGLEESPGMPHADAYAHGDVYSPVRGATPEEDHTLLQGNGVNWLPDPSVVKRQGTYNGQESSFWHLIGRRADVAAARARVSNGRASVKVQKLPKKIAAKMVKAWPKPIATADKGGTAPGLDPQAAATHQVLNDSLLERGAQEIEPQAATQMARNAASKLTEEHWSDSRRGRRAQEAQNQNHIQDHGPLAFGQQAVVDEPNARRAPIAPFTPKPAGWVGGDDDNYEQDVQADQSFWQRLGRAADIQKSEFLAKQLSLDDDDAELLGFSRPDDFDTAAHLRSRQDYSRWKNSPGFNEIQRDPARRRQDAAYRSSPEVKARNASPEGRAMRQAQNQTYRSKPEAQARSVARWQDPEVRATANQQAQARRAQARVGAGKPPLVRVSKLDPEAAAAHIRAQNAAKQKAYRDRKREQLAKGWPKDEKENQANAAAGAVAEDSMLDQGAKREEFGPDRDLLWEGLNQDTWEGGTHGDVQNGGRKMKQVRHMNVTKPSDEAAMNRHALVDAANENGHYGYPGQGGLSYGDIGKEPNPTATGLGSPFNYRDPYTNELHPHSVVYFPENEDAGYRQDMREGLELDPEMARPMQQAVERADQILAPPPTPKAEGVPAPDPQAWAKLRSKLGKKVKKVELPGQTHQPEKQVGPLEPQAPQFQPQNGTQLQAQRKKPPTTG